MTPADAQAHLTRQIARARTALGLERAAPLAMAPLLALAAWLGASLLGVHARLPPLAGSLLTIAALTAVLALSIRAAWRFRRPTVREARARLELDSGVDAGGLSPLDDQPAALDPLGLALWRREQTRARERAGKALAGPPRLDLQAADPWRLRYVAVVGLLGAALVAGTDGGQRLARALLPDPGPLLGDGPIAVEAWAAPDPYTGAAPVSLSDRLGETVSTPPSIIVTVRVTGPVGAPKLVFDGPKLRRKAGPGSQSTPFARAADGAWEAQLRVPGPGTLKVVRFHDKAVWRLRPAADAPPAIAFLTPPTPKDDGLAFGWSATDDYGVRAVALHVTPVAPPPGLRGAPAAETPLESPVSEPKEANGDVEIDLAAHPYAGLKVQARLIVRDALGQSGLSAPVEVTLPEKVFLQPLARAALEARKTILWERRPYGPAKPIGRRSDPPTVFLPEPVWGAQTVVVRTDDFFPRIERAPPGIVRAVKLIDALTMRPEDGYFADPVVFVGLELARATLRNARALDQADVAADILWEVASRAEYGDAADLQKALEQAQKALSEAIRRGAPPDEIARLSEALRRATQAYMQALVEEAIREGRQAENREDGQQEGQSMSQADIQELLREVERLAKEGRQAEAQALLQQLAQMLANMEVQLTSGPGEGGENPQDQKLNETIEDLSDAMREQRALRDETQREGEGEEESGGQTQDSQRLADRQEQLRKQLEEAQRGADGQRGEGPGQGAQPGAQQPEGQNGQTPNGQGEDGRQAAQSLDRAGRAMGEAERALRRGDLEGASRSQDEALRALRQGSEQLGRELLARQGARDPQQQRQAGRSRGGEAEGERDPLGRPQGMTGGLNGEEGSIVPDGSSPERVREILEELRRRAQDPRRPEAEREYLRRLLERFADS